MADLKESMAESFRETERTMLAPWPNAWREDFARQNELLAETGEEKLSPSEYLQCRVEDILELQQELRELKGPY